MSLTPSRIFLTALGILLLGYAFFGRGFAYLGIPPLFVGELVLILGLLTFALVGGISLALRSPLAWLLVLFMSWGAFCTIPFIEVYRLDALRDAVIWGYGIFALMVASFLLRSGWFISLPKCYCRIIPWFLIWIPIAFLIDRLGRDAIPTTPGSEVPIIDFKAGDAGVHLAGVAAFLLLGLHISFVHSNAVIKPFKEWLCWILWFVGFFFVAAFSRGGMLAVVTAIFLIFLFRPINKRFLQISVLAILLISIIMSIGEIDLGGARKLSVQQVTANIVSVFTDAPKEGLEGSKQWRIDWWDKIINYTLFGDFFWTGKGFGINLADADGFQVTRDRALRSPHNGHLTILARMGVPGFVLWVLLQVTFASTLLYNYFCAQRYHEKWWALVNVWILCYWLAFMINASFDVFLEGPQSGIWFWSLFGFGIAVTEAQRQILREERYEFPTIINNHPKTT
jgi:hypothetical protein